APRVADDCLNLVDVHELLGRLDAGLRVPLAVLRVGQHDLHVSEVHLLQGGVDVIDAEPRSLVPRLAGNGGGAPPASPDPPLPPEGDGPPSPHPGGPGPEPPAP